MQFSICSQQDLKLPQIIVTVLKKTKFLIKDFFIKSDQIRSFLWIW